MLNSKLLHFWKLKKVKQVFKLFLKDLNDNDQQKKAIF